MDLSRTIITGMQELSEKVYFVDSRAEIIRPIFQKDLGTCKKSYRVYVDGGNRKDIDVDVICYKELAKLLIDGHSVRCRLSNGDSSNRSLRSKDIMRLVAEIE